MVFDITKLSEAELIELNRRIVERLQLMRSAKNLTQLARFSVGLAGQSCVPATGAGSQRLRHPSAARSGDAPSWGVNAPAGQRK
jgi:hypothetical protein